MKSERRHELQENELANLLGKFINEKIKPNAQIILGALIIIAVAVIAYNAMSIEGTQDKNIGWDSLFSALTEDDRSELETVATANSQRPSGQWASLMAAQQYLEDGSAQAFTSPEDAAIDLQRALELFDSVIAGTEDKFLKSKALWGKALTLETKASEDDLNEAIATYGLIPDVWPESSIAEAAQNRISTLEDAQISGPEGFYAWYREQDFAELAKQSQAPPTIDSTLPGLPDISLPGANSLQRPDNGNKPDSNSLLPNSTPIGDLNLDSPNNEKDSKPSEPSVFSDKKEEEGEEKAPENKESDEKSEPEAE